MKIIEKQLNNIIFYPISNIYNPESIIYFDIETTGLSAETSYLYMIGVLIQKDNCPVLKQWLVDDISEEIEIIKQFINMLCNYKVLIHYNGQAFDIPYLTKKIKKYHLSCSFDSIESLDIYREIKPLKKILQLTNLQQKTVEKYLNYNRKDSFTGEELIEVYSQYIGFTKYEKLRTDISHDKSDALGYALFLHNEEDLIGLTKSCFLLYYISIIKGGFAVKQASINKEEKTAEFILSPDVKLKKYEISYLNNSPFISHLPCFNIETINKLMLIIDEDNLILKLEYLECELKYFFSNYQDYYYLPEEDTAVHKTIGEYVDKAYRQKAKKSSCYQRKQSIFLPQRSEVFLPSFKNTYKDKFTFFELTHDVFSNIDLVKSYLIDILNV